MSNKSLAVLLLARSAERGITTAAYWTVALVKSPLVLSDEHREEVLATLKTIITEAEATLAAAKQLVEKYHA